MRTLGGAILVLQTFGKFSIEREIFQNYKKNTK